MKSYRLKFLSGCIAIGLLCVLPGNVLAQNMLQNGDFESWTGSVPDGWEVESSVEVLPEQTIVHSGSYSVSLEATTSSNKGIFQVVPVEVGVAYEFSVYMYGMNGDHDMGIYVNWLDAGGSVIGGEGTFYNAGSGSWELVTSGEIVAPEGAVSARCRIRCYVNSAHGGYVDDASFTGGGPTRTPGPPTMTPTPTPTGPTPTPAATISIHDIQYTTDPDGNSPYVDQDVYTYGIVTAAETGNYSVFIQDGQGEWNGIMIYNPPVTLNIGDEVIVHGTVKEFNGWTEINPVTGVSILSNGNAIPDPLVVTTSEVSSEALEGVFVKVENVTVTNPDLGYGEWEIDDGSGPARVDDLFNYSYTPYAGAGLDWIQGPCYYSYGNFKIVPRFDADIQPNDEPTPTPQPTVAIKINEIYINPPGSDVGCYVELYYPGGVDLTGYQLVGVNGYNGSDYNVIDLTGYAIPADGFFVIAQDDSVANADMIDEFANYQNGPDSIQLRLGTTVVDAIGYGDFSSATFAGEGDPAPAYFSGEHSHSRYPDGADTDNNYIDFNCGMLTPGESNMPCGDTPTPTPETPQPTDTPTGPTPTPPPPDYNLKINEIHVNPDGQDTGCFVELYYNGDTPLTLDGYTLAGINGYDGSEYQVIRLRGEIPAHGFFVVAQDESVPRWDMVNEDVNYQNGPDNIQLKAGPVVVDAVGYGDFSGGDVFAGEGSAAAYPNPTGDQSLGRLPDGADTDNNSADFSLMPLTPGSANGSDTPTPTHTPVESPTPTPTTGHDTPTPIPTDTPTNTPTPTPTNSCGELGVKLEMPAHEFTGGDTCYLKVYVCNPNQETYYQVPLFVILDFQGTYFFLPGGGVELSYYTLNEVIPGETEIEIIPPFAWPDGVGEASDVIWYSAMTNAEITDLFGGYDSFMFGWH